MSAAEIATIISVLISLGALYTSLRRAPYENANLQSSAQKNEGDALNQYQMALDRASQQIAELSDKNIALQKRVGEMDARQRNMPDMLADCSARIAQLEIKVADQDHENALLRSWAGRLSRQVEFLGGVPVPFSEENERKTKPLGDIDKKK